jgi:hypothetical protein
MNVLTIGKESTGQWLRLKGWPNPRTSFKPHCHSLSIPLDAPPTKRTLGSQIIGNRREMCPSAARHVFERIFSLNGYLDSQ